MTSKAQTQASRKWEQQNPHRTAYTKLRRTAFSFVNPKPGSKAEEHIDANHDDYVEDLKELKYEIDKKMGETKMNATIKNLVAEKIDRHITTAYDDKVVIKKDSVDVKNGRIRFWELGDVTSWIDLADIDCTEDEAKELVKHCITEALFAISDKPVTDKFDTK
ncbi:hypothetical protein [Limosilactobacillus mucosae]|uniref:hypothetical protein n=1 Tax=Limosilactobacillus mucosae TaxID=97478 RepID=UPI000FFC9651|nr:hypothetical protein [Limosilactobacillus mucosae]RXA55433.1 hypothetical protein EQ839_09005 [Limosilactobacillus mucosae]